MMEVVRPPWVRVARTHRLERASGSACAMATKLYCPPTPLSTSPSARASDTAAPSSVTIRVVLMQRAQRRIEAARAEKETGVQHLAVAQAPPQAVSGHGRAAVGVGEVRLDPGAA